MSTRSTVTVRRPGILGASPKFVNDPVKPRREKGPLPHDLRAMAAAGMGVTDWIEARVGAKGGITLDEFVLDPAETHGVTIHRTPVWRVPHTLGPTHETRPASP